MSSYSRTLLAAFGIALLMLSVSSLVSALRLTQDVAAARQQALVWKTYALAVHSQGLLAAQGDAADCGNSAPCVSAGEAPIDRSQLAIEQAVEWLPASARGPVRGFSF